jgi:acyl-CoA reductase-like NAD-dependent aldehyde dehydrogenase
MHSTSTPRLIPFLVNGRWIEDGTPVEIRFPYNGELVGRVAMADRAALQEAIQAAVTSFETTRKMPAYERIRILKQVACGLDERKEEFARLIAVEAGKPIKTARGEVDRAIFSFSIAAEEAGRIAGEFLPLDVQEFTKGRWGIVRRFSIGPIAAITPFNFPLNLVAHKLAPAIAAGCSIVLKPAPQTPLTALLLGRMITEAGWPAGALNVLPLSNDDAALMVSDDRLKVLSFTGSTAVGWDLKAKAGKKRVLLELGGNAGVIIHSDGDLAYAVERCAIAGFAHAGQSCISVQRILVHRPVFDGFLNAFVERTKQLVVGDPLDEKTDIGPVIRESDAIRAVEWIDEAVKGGARVLCGGKRNGTVVEPTILTRTTPQMRVNCAEVFAPIKTVEPYDDFDEALRRINDTQYGLQAGVFTRDAVHIFRAFEELQVGGVIVGDVPTFRIDNMPYGGTKDSGMGREGLRYAIKEFTEQKLLVANLA